MISYNLRNIRLISFDKQQSLFEVSEKSALPNLVNSKLGNERKLVFVEGKNTESFCVLFAFLLRQGIPFLVFPPNLVRSRIDKLVADYLPTLVITDAKTDLYSEKEIVISDVKVCTFRGNDKYIHPELALMILTSGSTGSPQACKLSYNNILSSSEMISDSLNMVATDTAITTLPPSYIYGLSVIFSHFFVGASIFLQNEAIFSRKFWDELKQIKNSNFGAVPTQYSMLHKIYGEKLNLTGLRYLTQAGGAMTLELKNFVHKKCLESLCDFYVMYGQTEASPRICVNKITKQVDKMSSVGKVVPGGKISLHNIDKKNVGELCYEGPNVFMGYASGINDLEMCDPPLLLNTGDLATIDHDGYVEIVGRLKRITKINGIRTNLDSIESWLRDEYVNCAVISSGDDQLTVFIVGFLGDTKKIEISKHLGLHINKINFITLNELPLMQNQKIDYNALAAISDE